MSTGFNKKELAPVVLFVYNRPDHTRQTVESLQKNTLAGESELFIYSDAPKNDNAIARVQEVREYIKTIRGFRKVNIIEREENYGLANSVIEGVTNIIKEYGRIIVLEDDLVTSPYFLQFMNDALELYEKDHQVACVQGYMFTLKDSASLPETFFVRGADCWGWGTWDRGWRIFEPDGKKLLNELLEKSLSREADFNNTYSFTKMLKLQVEGKNDSWAIRWYMSAFLKGMLTLYPSRSLVSNIGFDLTGTHSGQSSEFCVPLVNERIHVEKMDIRENAAARKQIELFFKSIKKNPVHRILKRYTGIIKKKLTQGKNEKQN